MRAVVFSAGQVHDYGRIRRLIGSPDLVICADGGVRHALALGLTPTLVLGDFDSAGPVLTAEVSARGIPIHRVPADKDQTDTHLALEEALARGATEVYLVGATGSRLDHTLSNLLLLPDLIARAAITVLDGHNIIRLLQPGGRLTVEALPEAYLSLIPLTPEVRGVVAEGVKWPLSGATLRWGESLGVSNRIVGQAAMIAVEEGYLLVIQSWD
ncbi:MAG TPA: thiamine diphosphokinase [Symbiobacteriaceae bacterium]